MDGYTSAPEAKSKSMGCYHSTSNLFWCRAGSRLSLLRLHPRAPAVYTPVRAILGGGFMQSKLFTYLLLRSALTISSSFPTAAQSKPRSGKKDADLAAQIQRRSKLG